MTGVLFGGPDDDAADRTRPRLPGTAQVLITVKAAPQPSSTYRETVCIAGLRLDRDRLGWIRLYPINFRELDRSDQFPKYSIVTVPITPATKDSRLESWNPNTSKLVVGKHLEAWKPRKPLIGPWIGGNTCDLISATRQSPTAPSLALIRPADIDRLDVKRHPGWNEREQRIINEYTSQIPLFGPTDRRPLEPPRFTCTYRYRCQAPTCKGHDGTLLDWEVVTFQRRLKHLTDPEAIHEIQARFLDQICAADNDTCFYLGNQAKRRQTFSILGLWYPKK